jgi:hypothetical protein
MFTKVSRIALASAVLALGAQPAWAIDAGDFGAKLKSAVQLLGFSIDFATASAEGDSITLSEFTVHMTGEDSVILPGSVVFSGVAETGDGGYSVETASTDDITYDDPEEGVALALQNVAISGMTIPGTIDFNDLLPAAMNLYETASAGPLTVSMEGEDVFAIDSMMVSIGQSANMSELTSEFTVAGMRGDLSSIPDEEAQEVIAAFGLEQFSAEFGGRSLWYPETGRVVLEDVTFAVDNLASITIGATIHGYTRTFYQEVMKINVKMAEMAEAGDEISEAEMAGFEDAMLEKLMDVEIEAMSVRYGDASLFMKILDFAGAEQGVDGATFASGLKFMVPMMLTEVPNAGFKAMVTREVNAFINDPQSIEIIAAPETPVKFTDLSVAEDDPFALIDLLNLAVRANQ